jgi:ankyrin repeat protein
MNLLLLLAAAFALTQAPPLTKAEQLQDAARKGDAAAVRSLLDAGVDVNTKFRYDATALFYACDAGNVEVVKVLLDKGADLSRKDTFYGFTPLMLATSPARKKTPAHTEIVKLLVARGAPGQDAVLDSAVEDDDEALAKIVLDSGKVPAAALTDALEQARAGKKTKVAALLEKAGAKPYDEFKMDADRLAKFTGSYKNPAGNELNVVVAGTRLTVGNPGTPPERRLTLVARDATTFRAIGMQGAVVVFTIAGDKAASFALTPAQGSPATYTRVEGK